MKTTDEGAFDRTDEPGTDAAREDMRQCDKCHRWFPRSELHANRVGRTLDGRLESIEYICSECLEKD